MKLEICCYSIDDILTAYHNGADRIEFCSGRSDGGLTPSYGDLLQLSELNLPIAIHPIVRPRGGDFCYSQFEINSMRHDIKLIKQLNFVGVVFGCLQTDASIDLDNMEKLMNAAKGLSVTFHRAFDVCHQPLKAIQQINELGIDRLLTSGQQANALMGIELIEQLKNKSKSTIIMPGCGIRSDNLAPFIQLGINEFHSSATQVVPSLMQHQNHFVNMSQTANNEFLRYCVNPDEIKKMKKILLSVHN